MRLIKFAVPVLVSVLLTAACGSSSPTNTGNNHSASPGNSVNPGGGGGPIQYSLQLQYSQVNSLNFDFHQTVTRTVGSNHWSSDADVTGKISVYSATTSGWQMGVEVDSVKGTQSVAGDAIPTLDGTAISPYGFVIAPDGHLVSGQVWPTLGVGAGLPGCDYFTTILPSHSVALGGSWDSTVTQNDALGRGAITYKAHSTLIDVSGNVGKVQSSETATINIPAQVGLDARIQGSATTSLTSLLDMTSGTITQTNSTCDLTTSTWSAHIVTVETYT